MKEETKKKIRDVASTVCLSIGLVATVGCVIAATVLNSRPSAQADTQDVARATSITAEAAAPIQGVVPLLENTPFVDANQPFDPFRGADCVASFNYANNAPVTQQACYFSTVKYMPIKVGSSNVAPNPPNQNVGGLPLVSYTNATISFGVPPSTVNGCHLTSLMVYNSGLMPTHIEYIPITSSFNCDVHVNYEYLDDDNVLREGSLKTEMHQDFSTPTISFHMPWLYFENVSGDVAYVKSLRIDIVVVDLHNRSDGYIQISRPHYEDGFAAITYSDLEEYSYASLKVPFDTRNDGINLLADTVSAFLAIEIFPNFKFSDMLLFAFAPLVVGLVLRIILR